MISVLNEQHFIILQVLDGKKFSVCLKMLPLSCYIYCIFLCSIYVSFYVKVGRKNQQDPSKDPLSKDECIQFVKDIFISAAERDIHTGDGVLINIITKDGITEEFFPLRKD